MEYCPVEELEIPVWDPAFYLDDDNRLYLYWGCSDVDPIYGVEVDYDNGFAFYE
jgi:xylan 1,4-beta-xylosidase